MEMDTKTQTRVMRFRPCIDLHQGAVKQIIGGTLRDGEGGKAETNYTSTNPSSYYAEMYARDGLPGGHVIMLGPGNEDAAREALAAYPGGLQVGGGITSSTALEWLDEGASHVIVTSWVFRNGAVDWDRVKELSDIVGRERLVLDLSCRRKQEGYVVCADRWQTETDVLLSNTTLSRFGEFASELLVHAVDVEGRRAGMDETLLTLLASSDVPVTYAGGVRDMNDLELARRLADGRVDVTVGSALDIFGGSMRYRDAVGWQRECEREADLLSKGSKI